MASSAQIAKAGWLHRQTTFMKNWKKNWFVLTQDGFLRYYENENSNNAQDAVHISMQCVSLQVGSNVRDVTPAPGLNADYLLKLNLSGGRTWILCCTSIDDTRAWEISLDQARVLRPLPRPSSQPSLMFSGNDVRRVYSDDTVLGPQYTAQYAQYRPYGSSVTYVAPQVPGVYYYGAGPYGQSVVAGPGQTVIVREPYYRYRSPGMSMAGGMLAGAAIGSLMWTPFLWWC